MIELKDYDPLTSGAIDMPTGQPSKKKKRPAFTAFSLKYLRERNAMVGVTERWNPHAGAIDPKTKKPRGIRQDLFGFIDLVAVVDGEPGVLAVQSTSFDGISARVKKILRGTANDPQIPRHVSRWLEARNRLWIMGWRKIGNRWKPTIYSVQRIVGAPNNLGEFLEVKDGNVAR